MSERIDFFHVGGTLGVDTPSYIERPADGKLLAALEKGELCLVLAPRQTGKSSLMVHAAVRLKERQISAGIVDLQALRGESDPERWFSDVLYQIKRSLGLQTDSGKWWKAHHRLGPPQRFMTFLEDVVLRELEQKVVLFFDEIDSVLGLPFSDDFFTTIRSLYNARAVNPTLRRLTFVLLGVATTSSFIRDRDRSPFNIGRSIAIDDFNRRASEHFQQVLGPNSNSLIDRIFYWTNGQPLLVQKLAETVYSWHQNERDAERIDEEVEHSYLQRKIEDDIHLKFIQDYLLSDSTGLRKTLRTYRKVLKGRDLINNDQCPIQNHLKLAGVVRVQDGKLVIRNRIYESTFDLQWLSENIPGRLRKLVIYLAYSGFAFVLLWMFLIQPLLFPKFPEIERIVKYTSEPSIEESIPLTNTNVSGAFLSGPGISSEVEVEAQDRSIRLTRGSIPVGLSTYTLRLVGGLFKRNHDISIAVTYYPRWEIRQFPSTRLENFKPVLDIRGRNIRLRDINNGNVLDMFGEHPGNITRTVLSPDRKLALVGGANGVIKLWNFEKKRALETFSGHKGAVLSIALSPDKRTMISGGQDKTLILWDVKNERQLHTFSGHDGAVLGVAFSPDGKTVLSGSEDHTLKLWDVITGANLDTFTGHGGAVFSVAFSPDGKTVLSGSEDHTLKLWDVTKTQSIRTYADHSDLVKAVAFSRDGKWILSGSEDRTVRLWDFKTGRRKKTFEAGRGGVQTVAFSPDGTMVYWQSASGALKLWDLETGQELKAFSGHSDAVIGVAFSPDGNTVISGSEDARLKLWDVETGQELKVFSGHGNSVIDVAFSPDGSTVISGGLDNKLKLWDVKTGQELRTFIGHGDAVVSVAFSPNGKTVISGSLDSKLKLWDIESGRELRTLTGHVNAVIDVAFSPDGDTVISGSRDRTTKLWDVETGRELRTFSGHSNAVICVAFSPDGKTVISGSEDASLKLWDIETGKELRTFSGHSDEVICVAFSSDGKMLVSGSRDRTVRLWLVKRGQELRTFSGHSDEVMDVAFSPDGKTVISGSTDATLKLWLSAIAPK